MMRIKTKSEKPKQFFVITTIIVMIYCAVNYNTQLTQGVKNGLVMCTTNLIPSLFVFLVISSYITSGRCADAISRLLDTPSQKALKMSGTCVSVLLISMIGGYPVGAACIKTLYESKRISKEQAKKLSMMSVCSGVGFVTSYVANTLIKDRTITTIIFASVIISYIFVCIMCHIFIKTDCTSETIIPIQNNIGVVKAVENACKATINMCAMVMLFSAIICVLNDILSSHSLMCDAICMLLEVCTACTISTSQYPLYITSFVIGFGGICVHFQIFSLLKEIEMNKLLFFLIRILQGIISATVTYILLIFIEPKVSVFSSTRDVVWGNSTTVWGSVALMLTAVCFLNSIKFSSNHRR